MDDRDEAEAKEITDALSEELLAIASVDVPGAPQNAAFTGSLEIAE